MVSFFQLDCLETGQCMFFIMWVELVKVNTWSSFVMQRAIDRGYSSCWLLHIPQSALLMWLTSWGWVRRMLQTVCFSIHPCRSFFSFFTISMWKFYHIQSMPFFLFKAVVELFQYCPWDMRNSTPLCDSFLCITFRLLHLECVSSAHEGKCIEEMRAPVILFFLSSHKYLLMGWHCVISYNSWEILSF